jgi:hypothetical protein
MAAAALAVGAGVQAGATGPAAASAYGCQIVGGTVAIPHYLCQQASGDGLHLQWSRGIYQAPGWLCNSQARFRHQPYDQAYRYGYSPVNATCGAGAQHADWWYDNYLTDGSTLCASMKGDYRGTWSITQCHNIHK